MVPFTVEGKREEEVAKNDLLFDMIFCTDVFVKFYVDNQLLLLLNMCKI